MRLDSIRIQNFRGIKDAMISFADGLTVLVGANNVGKTTVLDALAAVLTYRRGADVFKDTDFRAETANADARRAEPITFTLRLIPAEGKRFRSGILGTRIAASVEEDSEHVRFELRVEYSKELKRIDSRLNQIDPEGQVTGLGPEGESWSAFPLRDYLLFRAFGPDRNLQRGMGGRWSDWSAILNDVRPSPEVVDTAARHFEKGSNHLISSTPGLESIAEGLRPAGQAVGLPGSEVKLSVASQDPAELLQQVKVELSLPGAGRGFQAERHGLGTQGAMLFSIYRLQVQRLLAQSPKGASAVLTVEEPEAHLHPTAQRSMATQIGKLPGQSIVTSHSPEFVSRASGKVVLLRSVRGATQANELETDQSSWLRKHPRAAFARCLVLTEGFEAEMVPCFAEALEIDLGESGIEIIDCAGQSSILPCWKELGPEGLGLPAVILADADVRGELEKFLRGVGESVPGSLEEIVSRLRECSYFTCEAGDCLEFEAAKIASGRYAEEVCREQDGLSLQDWLEERSNEPISKSWRKKLGEPFKKIGDLQSDEVKARATRLFKSKSEFPYRFARALTIGPEKDPSKIPERFQEALKTAQRLARD